MLWQTWDGTHGADTVRRCPHQHLIRQKATQPGGGSPPSPPTKDAIATDGSVSSVLTASGSVVESVSEQEDNRRDWKDWGGVVTANAVRSEKKERRKKTSRQEDAMSDWSSDSEGHTLPRDTREGRKRRRARVRYHRAQRKERRDQMVGKTQG
jgi:hypothetical protein